MRKSLSTAIYICDSLAVVRYPRGGELYKPDDFGEEDLSYDVYGNPNCKNLLITYGRLFSYACKAKETLAKQGIPGQNKEKQNNDKSAFYLPRHSLKASPKSQ